MADGDDEEAEAVVAGMVAAGVPAGEIGAGLALGLARSYRGPWPLIVLERAVRLADLLGEDAARVVLPVAAHGCACAPEAGGREPFRSADRRRGRQRRRPGPRDRRLQPRHPARTTATARCSLSGLALAYADAARWAVDRVGHGGAPARPARRGAAAGARRPGRRRRPRPCRRPTWPAISRDGPASTARGLAICLAARPSPRGGRPTPAVTSGVHRLLVLPKRERFTERHVDGEGLELPVALRPSV